MTQIDFHLTEDDLLAFAVDFNLHSTGARGGRLTGALALGFIGGLLIFFYEGGFGGGVSAILLGVVAGAVVALLLWFIYPRVARSTVKKMLQRQDQKIAGWYSYRLADDGIHGSGPNGVGVFYWSAIGDIRETADHVFVMVGGAQAIVIPKAGGDQTVAAFVSELRRRAARPR